jgi:hypothetical protein
VVSPSTYSSAPPTSWRPGSAGATAFSKTFWRGAKCFMKRVTAQWVHKAEHDVLVARHLFKLKPLLTDEISFHCQQAVEKLFKGMLAELGLPIQKTHDLTVLLAQLLPADPTLRTMRRGLKGVTRYAVEYR